jgi:hypothetical protein
MNQQGDTPAPQAGETAAKTSGRRFYKILLLSLIAVAILVSAFWFGVPMMPAGGLSRMSAVHKPVYEATASSQPEAASEKTGTMSSRLDDLTARVEKLEQAASSSGKEGKEQAARAEEDITRMNNDLIAMTAALKALQTQLKQESQSASATQSAAKTRIAEAVAFVQLRSAVDSGEDFSRFLQTLRLAAEHDAAVTAVIARLEPMAANGVLPLSALHEGFLALKASAQTEMQKAEAKTWKERLLAELKRFVSIRPLHGPEGGEGTLAEMGNDLARNNLKAALEKAKSLPEPAQTVLKEWLAKAEARQSVVTALDSIAARIVTQARESGDSDTAKPQAEE